MRSSLSPHRRKLVAIAGGTAAIAGSVNAMHGTHASGSGYSVLGFMCGIVVGGVVLILARRRDAAECAPSSE